MKKERLTREKIAADVTINKKDMGKVLLYITPLFLLLSLLTWWLCDLGGAFLWLGVLVPGVLAVLSFLLLCIVLGVYVKNRRTRRSLLCLVKDTLVGMEVTEEYRENPLGSDLVQFYHFNFKEYGEYTLCGEYFSWSADFYMGETGLYNSSKFGDEFYLVLSEPHTGRILTVYPAKWFEPEDALGPFLVANRTEGASAE